MVNSNEDSSKDEKITHSTMAHKYGKWSLSKNSSRQEKTTIYSIRTRWITQHIVKTFKFN